MTEHQHEIPTPRAVIAACLAQAIPCTACGASQACDCPERRPETEVRAELVEDALITYGYLPEPVEVSKFNAEETARWLAERTGFPRYALVADGWRRLLESEADVELAAAKAIGRVSGGEVEVVKGAKSALLAWHAANKV